MGVDLTALRASLKNKPFHSKDGSGLSRFHEGLREKPFRSEEGGVWGLGCSRVGD